MLSAIICQGALPDLVQHIYLWTRSDIMFIILLSFVVGFLFNEEVALRRICRGLAYEHEGWFILEENKSLLILGMAWVLALLKAVAWGVFLKLYFPIPWVWFLPAGLYLMGNLLAVYRIDGFYYTPWLSLLGIILVRSIPLFQGIFTVLVVTYLLTRRFSTSFYLGQVTFCILVFFYLSPSEGVFWIILILLKYILSSNQAPFFPKLIK